MSPTAATNLARYQSRAQKVLQDNHDLVLGQILWFSITESDDAKVSVPVRVTPDQLEAWFDELALDKSILPARIAKVNAFKKASSDIKATYSLSDSASAQLAVIEIDKDNERVVRHVIRTVVDSKSQTTSSAHVATLRFFRGARNASGQRHDAQHYKSYILDELIEIGVDNVPTGRKFPLEDVDRAQITQALAEFHTRYIDLSQHLQSQALRGMLRKYLATLNAIMCKPSGGVYFVLPEHETTIRGLQELLRRIGQGCSMTLVALWDEPEQREMLTDALAREIEVDCRKLLASIAEINAESGNGKIPPRQYARTNDTYQSIVDRAEEMAEKLGLAQRQAGASLELALMSLADLSGRIDPKLK